MPHWHVVGGALRYEFRMQVHRWSVWVVMVLLGLATLYFMAGQWQSFSAGLPTPYLIKGVVGNWALLVNYVLPIGFGVLLADRLPRDRRARVNELFDTLPGTSGARLLGKFLGSLLATGMPILLTYGVGIGYLLSKEHDLSILPLALLMFAVVNLPGLVFVAGFSVACPVIIWPPLYQFLFICYYFWGNLLMHDYHIPTLSHTMLAPYGDYRAFGIFAPEMATTAGWPNFYPTLWSALLSLVLMVGLGALALFAANRYLAWQQARQ